MEESLRTVLSGRILCQGALHVFTWICTTLGYAPLGLGLHTNLAFTTLGLGLGLEIVLEKVSPNPNGAYPRVVHIQVNTCKPYESDRNLGRILKKSLPRHGCLIIHVP